MTEQQRLWKTARSLPTKTDVPVSHFYFFVFFTHVHSFIHMENVCRRLGRGFKRRPSGRDAITQRRHSGGGQTTFRAHCKSRLINERAAATRSELPPPIPTDPPHPHLSSEVPPPLSLKAYFQIAN